MSAAAVVATAAVVRYPGQDPLRQRLARRRTETPGQAHTATRRGEFCGAGVLYDVVDAVVERLQVGFRGQRQRQQGCGRRRWGDGGGDIGGRWGEGGGV